MPLSDEEARLLHQLEQSLAQEDPDFASALRGSALANRNRKVAAVSGVGFLLGIGVLFAGAVTAQTWLGLIGFLLMIGAAYLFTSAWRSGVLPVEQPRQARAGASRQKTSFVDRMEQRWQKRRDEGF